MEINIVDLHVSRAAVSDERMGMAANNWYVCLHTMSSAGLSRVTLTRSVESSTIAFCVCNL